YLTVDGGTSVLAFNNMAVGQYYAIGVDMRDPYWVYGGLQDNGGWGIPSNSRDNAGILNDHVTVTNGGDGFHMQVDPTDWRTLYTTTHVGYFGRQNMETREHVFITPTPQTTVNFSDYYDPDFDEDQTNYSINPQERWLWGDIPNRTINGSILPAQFRWNWNSPLVLSPTNPRTIYVGSSHLFKSVDQGDTWLIVSPDLTKNDPDTRNSTHSGGLTKDATGAENYNTIYTIDESPVNSAVVWVGTDDGYVQITRNGGTSWANVTDNIPGIADDLWVSRVEASHFDAATAYVTLDGHWVDDTAPYAFKTTNFGESWTDVSGDLPRENPGCTIHTIVEDSRNPNLLFVGTEFGVYVTVDGGTRWSRFMNGLPPVAVHDLVIHPRDADLVAGTHGRSIWIADDISPLQQLSEEVMISEVHLFEGRVGTKWLDFSKGRIQSFFKFRGPNPPRGAPIDFYLRSAHDSVRIDVADPISGRIRTMWAEGQPGLNRVLWDMRFLPNDQETEEHRALLARVHDTIYQSVRTTRRDDILEQMRKDLLAIQRYPDLYPDAEYPGMNDARTLLLDHLDHIADALEAAESFHQLFSVREQLLAYSQLVGDQAFFGFYGEELTAIEAPAGRYRVTLTVDGTGYAGTVSVRDDPLKALR
ncbi:MAG: hypothetical protein AMS18_14390, partial [Gemmatimonas sp. SG8_17]